MRGIKKSKKCGMIVIFTLIVIIIILLIVFLVVDSKDNFGNTLYINNNNEEIKNLPNDSLFVIYSMGNSGYQEWQGDLLDFSFKKSKQPGTLIRVVSDDSKTGRKINKTKYGYTIITPDYSKITDNITWPVMNKPGSMKFLMDILSKEFKNKNKKSTLLFLDPDMIFVKPWDPRNKFGEGEVYGQKWKGYSKTYCSDTSINPKLCPESENSPSGPIMFPFAIKLSDFDKISDTIEKFAREGYLKKNTWEGDMTAFVAAIEGAGYKNIQIDNLGLCNNWDNSDDHDAPIMHFCQAAKDKDGKEIWGKRRYQKDYKHGDIFKAVPDSNKSTNRVDRETLNMINQLRNEQLNI